MTARKTLELRLGRPVGSLKDMGPDLRKALSMLAKAQIAAKNPAKRPLSVKEIISKRP